MHVVAQLLELLLCLCLNVSQAQQRSCPNGLVGIGQCVNGGCPRLGFSCYGTVCCESSSLCGNDERFGGSCVDGSCGSDYTCRDSNVCCGTGDLIPGLCSDGIQAAAGCFSDNTCRGGFVCENRLCCRQKPAPPCVCPNGADPIAACGSGVVCGRSFRCLNGYCCEPDSNQAETDSRPSQNFSTTSRPQSTTRDDNGPKFNGSPRPDSANIGPPPGPGRPRGVSTTDSSDRRFKRFR